MGTGVVFVLVLRCWMSDNVIILGCGQVASTQLNHMVEASAREAGVPVQRDVRGRYEINTDEQDSMNISTN